MKTKDYKKAAEKLDAFIHESKMFRDPQYAMQCRMIKQYLNDLERFFWNPYYYRTEPTEFQGIFGMLLRVPSDIEYTRKDHNFLCETLGYKDSLIGEA